MNDKTYNWVPAISAPEIYPVKILKGQFVSNNGYCPNLPVSAFVNMGWGESGGVMAVGPELKPIPDSLNVIWLSYAENKYYSGSFALPKEKITRLFEDGYIDHEENNKVTYYYLTLAFTPKGGITLWAVGAKQQIQIATFNATETKVNPDQLKDEERIYLDPAFVQESYIESIPDSLRTKAKNEGYSPLYWERALKRYKWNFGDKAAMLYELNASYVNAEREHLFGEDLKNNQIKERALPQTIYLYWLDEKKQMMISEIQFDPEETRQVFTGLTPEQSGTLAFEIERSKYKIKPFLQIGKRAIPFQKVKIKTEISSN
ncbi:DUF2931 family protein [Pedobacter mendelii]|uniref:DUF2931 family protein n=1 Tax=Pedobacter mendelii TaxID=1908240 RepID=A0ABQ2BM29_9SPHI|nr:DUF2931 family protein [Pedobacter mendelii]GGI29472.1 hypothetical protein GCM10008119_37800 [Pedobacter mendelii]